MTATAKQKKQFHKYYIKNKGRWKKYIKPKKTEEEKLEKRRLSAIWKENHPEKHLWSSAKYRAKKESIDFNIEISDVIIPAKCKYLNFILTSKKGNRRCDELMSLDRIDSKRGYVKGNIEVISYKANRMKNDATLDELIIFAKNILDIYVKDNIS